MQVAWYHSFDHSAHFFTHTKLTNYPFSEVLTPKMTTFDNVLFPMNCELLIKGRVQIFGEAHEVIIISIIVVTHIETHVYRFMVEELGEVTVFAFK